MVGVQSCDGRTFRFIVLSTHYIVQALMFSRARVLVQPTNEFSAWQIPLLFVGRYATAS